VASLTPVDAFHQHERLGDELVVLHEVFVARFFNIDDSQAQPAIAEADSKFSSIASPDNRSIVTQEGQRKLVWK